jgi:hypothetical protein
MSARAIVSGVLFKAATEKASKAGNAFATFPIRETVNGATRWWQCIAFGESMVEVLKAMIPGEPIAVAGEISAEIYAPAGAESRINWRIAVDAVLSARKPPKAKPDSKGRKPQAAKGLDRAEASHTGGSALAAASWASPSPLNDDIPF